MPARGRRTRSNGMILLFLECQVFRMVMHNITSVQVLQVEDMRVGLTGSLARIEFGWKMPN